ncbi:MAG: mechanosensitive ion channel family protein [Desulfobacterales bacterium]|nr:MAG: mechanosensitive ion channel family protein [Desulfobacterales bacterium]
MRHIVKTFLSLTLVIATLVLLSSVALGQESRSLNISTEQEEGAPPPRGIADLIPFATKLTERKSVLETKVTTLLDLSEAEKRLFSAGQSLETIVKQFETLKNTAGYGYDHVSDLKAIILAKERSLQEVVKSLLQAISQLERWKTEWLDEKKKLKEFRESLPKDVPRDAVEPTLAKAQTSIDTALVLISEQLGMMLPVQEKALDIQAKVDSVEAAVSAMLTTTRSNVFRKSAPSMFSGKYYSQYKRELYEQVQQAISDVQWPSRQFLEFHGWKVFLQALVTFAFAIGILRQRKALEAQERWRFLARRPLSAGWFVSMWLVGPFYGPVAPMWVVILWTLGAIAAVRLLGALTSDTWKKRIFYCLAVLTVLFHVFRFIGLPLPFFRLYVFIVSLTGFFLCLRQTLTSVRRGDAILYTWLLRLSTLVLLVVVISEMGGYSALASHVLEASLKTTFMILLGWMFIFLVRGGLHVAVRSTALQKIPRFRTNETAAVSRLTLLIGLAVFSLITVGFLVIWRIYESPLEAMQGLLSVGFSVGSSRITFGVVIVAATIFYASFLVSWVVQGVLFEQVFPRRSVQTGVQVSIARLVHYALIFVGFLLALVALGIDLRNITIIGGALGVGIGFGLQAIVNNFVSGLILLFERPVKVGDWVQLDDQWGEISKIGLRATVVKTFDRSEVVVPNSDLVTNRVTNWTLSDRFMRITIPVGVAYGSDVPLVMQTLKECAYDNPMVVSNPAPQILFMGFGDSSLDFQVRVWIHDVDNMFAVRSELHQEIDRRFRESGIVIAFPQRDLHLRNVDESAASTFFHRGGQPPRPVSGQEEGND